jgi:hypothetical protein
MTRMSFTTDWLIPLGAGLMGATAYGALRQRKVSRTGVVRYGTMLRVGDERWFGSWLSIGPSTLRRTSRGVARRKAPAEVPIDRFAFVGERGPVGRERLKFMPGSHILHIADGPTSVEVVVGPMRGLRAQVVAKLRPGGSS